MEETRSTDILEENKNSKNLSGTQKKSFLNSLKNDYDDFQKVQFAPSKFKGRNVRGNLPKDFNKKPKVMTCESCGKLVDKLIYNSHIETHPSKIFDWLYLGSYNNALNKEELLKMDIKYILNCATECRNMFLEDFSYKKLLMTDSPSTKLTEFLEEAFEFIEIAKQKNSKILVHCQLGKSRSSSILIAYLIKYFNYEWDSAYTFLKNKRKIVFPNLSFMNELKLYSKTIRENNKIVNK